MLNDFEMVTKVKNIDETLVKVASYHRINRGKVLGIRNPKWFHSKLVADEDISLLPTDVAPHIAWELLQEHQEATTTQLLEIVSQLHAKIVAACPLSDNNLQKLVSEWKLRFVWSNNAIDGSSYTLGETEVAILQGIAATSKSGEEFVSAIDGGRAVDFVREWITIKSNVIINEKELKHLHSLLLRRSFRQNILIGEYREGQTAVHGSSFEFPPSKDVPALMRAFIEWLNSPKRNAEHPIEVAVEAHQRFVTIHPFDAANGRLARLLMNIMLLKRGYPPVCIAPTCDTEYLESVRHYQTVTMESTQLLDIVVNEAMAALEILNEEIEAAQVAAQ
eukprot:gene16895-19256_t